MQDATPIRLGQEISGWRYMLDKCDELLKESKAHLLNLAIGGTAVGTGINAHPEFGDRVAEKLKKIQVIHLYLQKTNSMH